MIDLIGKIQKIFKAQPDVPITLNMDNTERDILNLSGQPFRVGSFNIKLADPGVNTCTIKLYELINNVSTVVDTKLITQANFGTYYNLMDMFGKPHLQGDDIIITGQMGAVVSIAMTGQYSYEEAN